MTVQNGVAGGQLLQLEGENVHDVLAHQGGQARYNARPLLVGVIEDPEHERCGLARFDLVHLQGNTT